ncbi:MAG TPA: hypothetical protein VK176_12245 [Phycisphaerales bacterium]|nr:hypothetical protein [Phycisphaerales bacterium]
MKRNLWTAAMVAGGVACTSGASLSIINADRFVQSGGSITEDGSTVAYDGGSISGPVTGWWADSAGTAVNFGGGSVNGAGTQSSDFTKTGLFFTGIADISAGGYVTTITDPEGNTTDIIGEGSGASSSYFRVRFSIAYTGLWRFAASSLELDGGTAEVYFTDGWGNIQYSVGGGGADQLDLLVPAGTYEIWGHAQAGVTATGSTFAAARSEFAGSFTPVPSPGWAGLVCVGIAAGARRRR